MRRIRLITIIGIFYAFTFSNYAQNNQSITNNVQNGDVFYHVVERGQTVYSIARMYNVSVDDIFRLNIGSEESIRAGQQLLIPQKTTTTTTTTRNVPNASADDNYIYHTILPGDSLYGVSRRYGVSAESILEANPGLSTLTFSFNKTIRIPKTSRQQPIAEIVDRNGRKEIYYKVPPRETVTNICRIFKTTEKELQELNPELAGGLRAGMTLRIPLRISEADLPKEPEPDARTVNELLNVRPAAPRLVNAPKVALLLPFSSNNPQAELRDRITEYYEGLLLAVDTLRKQGHSMELFVYDIEESEAITKKILQDKSEELKKVNLIIGGRTTEQIKLIADFAKQNKIKYVIPFTSRDENVNENAFIFQVNTPQAYQYANAAYAGANLFWKHNIIFLNTQDSVDQNTDFINEFKQELKDRNISYKEAVYDAENFETDILSVLSTSKPNMLMPLSRSLDALIKIKSVLRSIAETQPEYSITLFGYPEWQQYTKECLEDFHALNTYIYSSFYADNIHSDLKMFYEKYKNWYSKSPMLIFPKYAVLGYDTGMYFFSALHNFGVNFEDKLSEIYYKSLQNGFNFERINNWGGFINTNVYIVRYNKDYSITRSEFR